MGREKNWETMTPEEIQAENSRLERELYQALHSNDRLARELEMVRREFRAAKENWSKKWRGIATTTARIRPSTELPV